MEDVGTVMLVALFSYRR